MEADIEASHVRFSDMKKSSTTRSSTTLPARIFQALRS